jgi:DNA-binding transcriptional regulator LsrR (DeoR family)
LTTEVSADQIRLMVKIARMYHERGMRQPEIAAALSVSQPRVSRLLKRAAEMGIVQTTVVSPAGVYSKLEDDLEAIYGLREAVIVDADTDGSRHDDRRLLPALGAAAATYLETTLTGGERIGISSWSSSLLATVEAMRPRPAKVADSVVQLLGGFGTVTAQAHATRLVERLAEVTGAEARHLPAPGLVGSASTREALMADPSIEKIQMTYADLTLVLVGVGSLEPSPLLVESGNALTEAEQEDLRRLGAVGDVCLRFFDDMGRHVDSTLDGRVIGISPADLLRTPRRVGVAGGGGKHRAVRSALLGGWINVLITDVGTAQRLLAGAPPQAGDSSSETAVFAPSRSG